jgi:tetratricopeptide (TPR) repeat protein
MRKVSDAPTPQREKLPQKLLNAAKPQPCRNAIDTAQSLLDAKNYQDAEKILCTVGLDHPDIKPAVNLLIRSYYESGRIPEAEKVFSYAAREGLLSPVGCASMILAHGKTDHKLAYSIFNTAVKRGLVDVSVFKAMIQVYVNAKMSDNALTLMDRALKNNQADTAICRMVFRARLELDNYQSAKKIFRKAVENNFADETMLTEFVDFCRKSGRGNCIIDVLRCAERKDFMPDVLRKELESPVTMVSGLRKQLMEFERTLPGAVRNYGSKGAPPPKKTSLLERVLGNKSEESANCNFKIHHYLSIGDIWNAFEAFQKATREDLVDEPMYYMLLLACRDAGDFLMAKQVFDTAVLNNRADERIRVLAASICIDQGRADEAKEILLNQPGATFDSEVYGRLFELCYTNGKYTEILSFIADMPLEFRNNPRIDIWRLDVFRKMKNYEKVLEGADLLLQRPDIDDDSIYMAKAIKAYALTHSGKPAEAFAILEELVETVPADNISYLRITCGLIFAYKALGDKRRLSKAERGAILEHLRSRRGRRNENMNADIENAIRILECRA